MIHIAEKQTGKILDYIPLGEFWDDIHRKSLKDTLETFDFRTFGDKRYSQFLSEMNRVIIPDEDGTFIEFTIDHVRKYRNGGTLMVEVYSSASYLLLKKAKVIRPQKLTGYTVSQHLGFVLNGTDWRPGIAESDAIRTIEIEYTTNPYAYIKRIANEFDLEVRFRVETDGNKVIARYVDLLERVGEWQGREVEFGSDLLGIERKEDFSNIVTALIGLGPEREDGTRLEVLVEDEDALQRWGIPNPQTGELMHLIEVYEPESFDQDMTLNRLTELTRNELEKRINSSVQYIADVADLEKVPGMDNKIIRFGDTLKIKDIEFNPPLYMEARVHTQERSLSDPSKKKVILGDYIEFTEEEVNAIWKTLQAEIVKKVSMAEVTEVVYIKTEVDQKDNAVKDYAEGVAENKKQEAIQISAEDATNKANLAENRAKNHADSIAEQKKQEAINAAIADADAKLSAAKTELEADIALKADAEWVNGQLVLKENAIKKSNTAPANPTTGQLWLDTSVTPNVLKRWSGSAWVKATPTSAGEVGAYTKTEVDNALNSKVSVTQYTTDMNGVVTRLNSAESRITQTEQEIATKVSNTTYQQDKTTINNNISQLQTKMSNAETSISQLSSQIALKANATDVYTKTQIDGQFSTVNQQISQINAELIVQADQISQKVTKTEFLSNISDFSFERGKELWSENNSFTSNVSDVNATVKNEGITGGKVLELTGTKWVYFKNPIPVDTSRIYRVRFRVRQIQDPTSGGSAVYAGVATYDKDGNLLTTNPGTHRYCAVAGTAIRVTDGWKYFEGTITGEGNSNYNQFRPGTTYVKPMFIVNYNGGNGIAQVDLIEFKDITEEINAKNYTDNSLQPVNTRLTTAETSITQLSDQISLKANKSEVDTLAGRMTNAESSINILTNQIALKANQSTVDSLTNRISSAESSINLLSNQIDLKVDVDGVISAINVSKETIKLQASKIDLDGFIEAKHIKSLNGLSINDQFLVDSNGNVKFKGNLEGATGSFSSQGDDGWSYANIIDGSILLRQTVNTSNHAIDTNIQNGALTIQYKTGTGVINSKAEYRNSSIRIDDLLLSKYFEVSVSSKITTNLDLDINGLISTNELEFKNSSGVIFDQYGNIKAKSTVSSGAVWHLDNYNGTRLIEVPVGSTGGAIKINRELDLGTTNDLKAQDVLANSLEVHAAAGGYNLYLRPNPSGEVRVTAAGGNTTYRPIRSSNFITDTSIRENKKDIEVFEDSALEGIRNAKVYTYRRKTDAPDAFKQLGLMVDETPRILHGEAGDSFDLYALTAYTIKGVKELDSKFMILEDEVSWLKIENQLLKQKIQQLEEMMVA